MHDAQDSPVPVLKGALASISKTYGGKVRYDIDAKPGEPGHYQVFQLQKKEVDGDYTPSKKRQKWNPNFEDAERVGVHSKFGKIYKHPDGTWWSKDLDDHGGSKWKVFEENGGDLDWIADADEYGDYIEGKHKGPTGKKISLKSLRFIK